MTNIKDISKQLIGEGLKAFHRKVGLESIERNNEMQSKVLQGIYSQVDDNYLEKTEESNVIHLDGSGDGVVEIESIEGNSLVNIFDKSLLTDTNNMCTTGAKIDYTSQKAQYGYMVAGLDTVQRFKSNTYYTVISVITKNTIENDPQYIEQDKGQSALQFITYNYANTIVESSNQGSYSLVYSYGEIGIKKCKILTKDFNNPSYPIDKYALKFQSAFYNKTGGKLEGHILILEGDWTDKEIPPYFEGIQSSFEEKVNEQGKYEIEILSHTTKNLYDLKTVNHDWASGTMDVIISPNDLDYHSCEPFDITHLRGRTIYAGMFREGVLRNKGIQFVIIFDENKTKIGERFNITSNGYLIPNNAKYMRLMQNCGGSSKSWIDKDKYCISLQPFISGEKLEQHKLNKIKLLVNKPLRGLPNGIKDRLCVKDGKLVVERKCESIIFTGDRRWKTYTINNSVSSFTIALDDMDASKGNLAYEMIISDKLPTVFSGWNDFTKENISAWNNNIYITYPFTKGIDTIEKFNENLRSSNIKLLYQLAEPYYEEVLNEYGEPILLEGYENGTLYIDSIIVPTTSVRYTQKFESRNELKNLNKNNISITSDINSNIIPYMMDVDMMIIEKEMALMSQLNTNNITKMEVLDMTSMQKRTFDMLKRLIEGKTLTEQECKDRVLVYLDADKITAEQASELMLIIAEKYA